MSSRSRLLASAVSYTLALALAALPVFSACSTTANITDAYMSLDSDGARRRDIFFTDTTEIHCLAQGGFGRPDVTVEAKIHEIASFNPITGNEDPVSIFVADTDVHPTVSAGGNAPPTLLDFQYSVVTPTTDAGAGNTSDESSALPFPAGKFVCEIFLDGDLVKEVRFDVDYPPCPSTEIVNLTPCLGFYPLNKVCPQSGLGGSPQPTCACNSSQGWNCP